ncbi:MAG: DUF4011 domain-containing protein [Gemmataceae bacterium]|nr:DUF4011 domain-containing protein [Gemmataceae bacterium]
MAGSPVDLALTRWRNNLIDLTRRNPLLGLRPVRSAYLEIVQPGAAPLFNSLVLSTTSWTFYLPPALAPSDAAPADAAPADGEGDRQPLAASDGPTRRDSPDRVEAAVGDGSAVPNAAPRRPSRSSSRNEPKATELLTTEADRGKLLATLANLLRRARADFRERGLHILHIACGVLEWLDADKQRMRSPLLLVPVQLKRNSLRDPFVLEATEDDPWLNPALVARLKLDHEFALPAAPLEWEEDSFNSYLEAVEKEIRGLDPWRVSREAILAPFSFHKGVIYQDLHENSARIQEHPLVQLLAGVPNLVKPPTPVREEQLDDQDPASATHILDADASQRLALALAAQDASFVLIGPPGTGKSQTIANLIADRIAAGKKVLFVSEKMAALEVVEQRLHRAGLGDYLLELHSHKANKRAVVAELARCLQLRRKTPTEPPPDESQRLRQRQRQLNSYVEALHRRRDPLGKSAWEVLAELPRWQDLPTLPLDVPLTREPNAVGSGLVIDEINSVKLDELTQMLHRAEALWPIRAAPNHPWLGFKAERFTLQLRDEIIGLLDKARSWGEKTLAAAEKLAAQLHVAASVEWFLRLGDLLDHRPGPVPVSWLLADDLASLKRDIDAAADHYQRLREGRAPLTAKYGPSIWKQPAGAAERLTAVWQRAAEWLAPGDEAGAKLLALQQRLRGWAADTQKRLPSWNSDLRTLERWLGLTLPTGEGAIPSVVPGHEGTDPAPQTLKLFLRLTHLCHSEYPPERAWLTDPSHRNAAQAVILAARPEFTKYRTARQRLLAIYTEGFFDLELDRIAAGYAGPYQSWFRWFNGQYRRDRRSLVRRSRTHTLPPTVEEDVVVGRDVQVLRAKLEAESPQRWQKLGKYERGLETDLEAAEKALKVATEALDLLRQLGEPALPDKFIDALCSGAPGEKVRAAMNRLQESFGAWWHETQALAELLPMSQVPGGSALEETALSVIIGYARELQARLNPLAALTDPLLQAAPQPPVNLAGVAADLRAAEALLAAETPQEAESQQLRARFGKLFAGPDTDWENLKRKTAWARKFRDLWNEAAQDKAATSAEVLLAVAAGDQAPPSFRELRSNHDHFRQAVAIVEHRFDAPGPKLEGKPWREQPTQALLDHLGVLRQRIGELADAIEWRRLPEQLARLGLNTFWQAVLAWEGNDPPIVELFHKAFWGKWLEWVFQRDAILANFRREDHERLLEEFRELDSRLLEAGPARVHWQWARFSGPLPEAEAALLLKEAHKKTRHRPLRQLFDEIPTLLLQLKPCLLMSPLSVSQFLSDRPDRLVFDLVVFDEASQIVPEDAIAAIVRGKQIVVTGDNRQLPPTTFFQQNLGADDGDEREEEDPGLFESVLDACLGAGLPQQWLRWHYRSRHESLIAFANDRIYDNRLVTFPGAVADDAELGVHFRYVPDGCYRRGDRRDNPREAAVVADLVVEHFRRRPDKSLGVIAFSFAQMATIEAELERRAAEDPELERFLQDDRLDGFFVKNLETVQGDERDIIVLSVGYGRDESGKIVLNFGPLNRQGGERRLNVAITRAKEKLVVVSSIRAHDIAKATTAGLQMLQQYLDYAEHGFAALRPDPLPRADAAAAHGLEADVRRVLAELGYTALPRVGYAAYRVDLAVVDPKQPGRFILGVEFDGPSYRQATTARDRDRLRHEVMTRLGWRLHRIWSIDWLLRRAEEIQRLTKALESGGRPDR